jgi:hypothetical protein
MRYNSSDDDSHPLCQSSWAMLDATSACPGDVKARLAIGRHAEIVRAYGRSFDPAAGFMREHAERSIAFQSDQPWMAGRRCQRLRNAR